MYSKVGVGVGVGVLVVQVCYRVNTDKSVWKNWNWQSDKDLFVNGATFTEFGGPIDCIDTKDMIEAQAGTAVTFLTRYAGPLKCRKGQGCQCI